MVNKKFWATAFTLTGTVVGAGILGLPYVFSQSGAVYNLYGESGLDVKARHHPITSVQ